jgi:glucose uptake protein
MYIVDSYPLAIIFCVITMLCWGSWANTQKLVQKKWRFELFYWDYVIGIFLFSLILAMTMGSNGSEGRPFLDDLPQVSFENLRSAFLGGIVFNLANILFTAAIAGAGMAVAFPIGIGLALVIGVIINYVLLPKGDPNMLFGGVALVVLAVLVNAFAYKMKNAGNDSKASMKWIFISVIAGILMSVFYPFVASGMDLENFVSPAVGKMTPYTAFVVFSTGILVSNLLFNSLLMKRPLEGAPITYKEYFAGGLSIHSVGVLGGFIWALGFLFNLIASGKAGPAISYGLGQGATLVAAFWGVVIWKEFKGSGSKINTMLLIMFILFILGLGLIIAAGN